MRSPFVMLLTAAVLLTGAAPALGCLNDREVKTQEREFKSSYEEQPAPYVPGGASPSTDSQAERTAPVQQADAPLQEKKSSHWAWVLTTLLTSVGLVLLAGALMLGLTGSRRS